MSTSHNLQTSSLFFLSLFGLITAEESIQKIFAKNQKVPLLRLADIISALHVHSETECSFACLNEPACVGFKYKHGVSGTSVNCQLSNTTGENDLADEYDKGWAYFIDINALPQYRTCSALLAKHPSATSGTYHINPQGLSSSPLVQVYCDMTSKNGVGVTVIGHDSESRTLVNGYYLPGSYRRDITYDISMEQIVAIMSQSKNCEQFIKYECHNSVFRFGSKGTYYGWWVSRQGSQMNYWGGAAVNSGKCACGKTNSCAGGGKCNCDKNDYTWREDSGYLTDKKTLPVSELRFGDTFDDNPNQSGYHTLGKLRCWN